MFALLAARRFGPLFATQFLGAFNDNLYKTAMLFLITYRLLSGDPQAATVMVTLAGGLFILPFLLFSSVAGQFADAHDKARIIRWVKGAEIAIMVVGAVALSTDSIALLMLVLFAMGTHSTFFGPIKYAILPQHLGATELLAGTALVEGGTYVAILTGQIAGGLMGAHAAWGVVVVAIIGLLTGRMVPSAPPVDRGNKVDWNLARASWRLVAHLAADKRLLLTCLAVSWFWAMGAVLTTQFVPLVKDELGAGEGVATLFLAIFSIGVATGSIFAAKLLHGEVSARHAPAASIGVSLFLAYVVAAADAFPAGSGNLTVAAFLGQPMGWHVAFALLGLAVSAGIFVVPLYAMLQTGCGAAERARTIAANNIVNSCFMVLASLIAAGLVAIGLSVSEVLITVGIANLAIFPAALRLRAPVNA